MARIRYVMSALYENNTLSWILSVMLLTTSVCSYSSMPCAERWSSKYQF